MARLVAAEEYLRCDMSLDASAQWLIGAVIVIACTVPAALWLRHSSTQTWEQTVAREHRWSSRGPLILVVLVAYVVTSSVPLALVVGIVAQWWVGGTRPAPEPARRGSTRETRGS
jgi:hypothetical protein